MSERGEAMKIKVDWVELLKRLWIALRPFALGLVGGGIVSVSNGCSFYGTGIGYTG